MKPIIHQIDGFDITLQSTNQWRVGRIDGFSIIANLGASAARALQGIKAATAAADIEIVFHIGRDAISDAQRRNRTDYAAFHLFEWQGNERMAVGLFAPELNIMATGVRDSDTQIDRESSSVERRVL